MLLNWHTRFNAEYFGGLLSTPIFKIRHNSTRKFGQFSFTYEKTPGGKGKATNQTITIYDYYDRSMYAFQTTFIHEMIHQWQAETFGTIDHGRTFKSMADSINNRSCWNIKTHSTTNDPVAEGITPRKRGECYFLVWDDVERGRRFFCFSTIKFAENFAEACFVAKENRARYKNLQMYKVGKDDTTDGYIMNRSWKFDGSYIKFHSYEWDLYGDEVAYLMKGKENLINHLISTPKFQYANAIVNVR